MSSSTWAEMKTRRIRHDDKKRNEREREKKKGEHNSKELIKFCRMPEKIFV